MRVAVRVDSSSAAESGMGLVSWCLGVGPVAGSENEVGGGKCGERGRPKAAILFLDGAFGGNCGTAIGMGSGWTGDRLGAGPGVGAGEKEVGVGAQCAGAEQAGHDCFLGSWVEALVGTAGGRARRNRDGLGAGVEAPRRRSEVEAGAEAGAAEGRDFFLGGAGFAWWELRHRNRDGQRMDRGWASVLVLA